MQLQSATRKCTLVATAVLICAALPTRAEQVWTVTGGTATLSIYHDALDDQGLFAAAAAEGASSNDPFSRVVLNIAGGSDLTFIIEDGAVADLFGRRIQLDAGLELLTRNQRHTVINLVISDDANLMEGLPVTADPTGCSSECLELHDGKATFNARTEQLSIYSRQVLISDSLAAVLGEPGLAGTVLGSAHLVIDAIWVDGDAPTRIQALPPDGGSEGSIGPDVTMCQVYGLRQFGRVGDIVGMASAGTSWNIGDEPLDWFARPNPLHPFIIFNMYRLKTVDGTERFEQIGESWIKHGFCALDNEQCSTQCQGTGCSTLGLGCTDTYSAGLNASQGGLGPKSEVNPWTGEWSYAGSHFQTGGPPHTGISHRLQVHDADLDPAQNPGAQYFSDQYYVCHDDVNMMNSIGWKSVTVNGSPGGTWSIGMSGPGTMPNIGLTSDAWAGARRTVLAQEVPLIEFVSPDGRCVLSTKATELGGGTWHYEYALYNVDMDRKVGAFSIPVPPGATITNVGFHAVDSHDEPYSNDPWDVEIANGAVTWTTVDNPLVWAAMYNFRFDANAPPDDLATVTLGMWEPGTPATVTGITTGPGLIGPAIVHGIANTSFQTASFSGYIDPRAESDDGVNHNLGLTEITIEFSEPVRNIGGAPLSPGAFSVRQTGAGAPPNVTGISTADNQTVTVLLDRIITLQEWTTIEADVENLSGQPIADLGDLGPGNTEPDRVDVGFLPCDVRQTHNVSPFDLLTFRQIVNDVFHHPQGVDTDYIDMDRDGSVSPFDLLVFRQLINGVSPPATQSWAGASMNNTQP